MGNKPPAVLVNFYTMLGMMDRNKTIAITYFYPAPKEIAGKIYVSFKGIGPSYYSELPRDRVEMVMIKSRLVAQQDMQAILDADPRHPSTGSAVRIEADGYRHLGSFS